MTEVQSLNQRHYKMLDLALAGLNGKTIADRLDMSPQQVYTVINSPSFQHELAIRRSSISEQVDNTIVSETVDAMKVLKDNTVKAARTLVGQLDSEKEEIAQKSAMDILDRAGFPKVSKNNNTNLAAVVCIDAETAMLLKETLLMETDKIV